MADDDIRVRIAGDLTDINKSLADLRRQTRGSGADAKTADRDFRSFGRGLDTLKRQVAGVVGAYLGFRAITSAIRSVVRASVEQERVLAQVEARIKSTGGAAGVTTEELAAMAAQFQRSTTFGDEDVLSAQAQLLTFTKITRENFEASTEAVLNLSTAMQQDLRTSVISIGKALNDPIAGLTSLTRSGIQFTAAQRETIRSLVETGQTAAAQRVILAELETQFGGAARAARATFGGALAGLKNAAGDLLEADRGLPGVTGSVNDLTDTLNDPAVREGFQVVISGILGIVRVGAKAVTAVAQIAAGLRILATGGDNPILQLDDRVARLDRRINRLQTGVFGRTQQGQAVLEGLLAERKRLVEEWWRLIDEEANRGPEPTPDITAGAIDIDRRLYLRTLQADLQAAGTLLADEMRRAREGLDRELAAGIVSYGEYFNQRAAIESRQIEQTIAQRRNSLALLDEEIALLEARGESTEKLEAQRAQTIAEITVLERQRADVAGAAARDQAAAEAALQTELQGVATRLKALQGDTVGARTDELAKEFSGLVQRLAIEGDVAGIELVQKLFSVELARAQLDKLESEYALTLAELGRQEQALQTQVQSGAISEQDARRQTIELYARQAERVRALIPVMRELAEATGDPAALERVRQLEAELIKLETAGDKTTSKLKAGFQDAAENAVAGFLDGTKSIGNAFRSLVDDIVKQLARIASQQIVAGLFGTIGAGTAHAGGIAGQAASVRQISPIEFIGAPRMHFGGIAGLGPGEVPAILRRGEEVLTESNPRHRNNAGQAPQFNQYIDARGSADPAGVLAAGEALKQQTKAEMAYEMRRNLRVR